MGARSTSLGYSANKDSSGTDVTCAGTASGAVSGVTSSGTNNVCIGSSCTFTTTNSNNVLVGYNVSAAVSNAIYLSYNVAAAANTIQIGVPGTQTTCFIAGIRGVTTGVANGINVLVDSAGQLGTTSSSRRYKSNIQNIKESKLSKLRPVKFDYLTQTTPKNKHFGLIAEEVIEVYPELVILDSENKPETVQYHKLVGLITHEIQQLRQMIAAK